LANFLDIKFLKRKIFKCLKSRKFMNKNTKNKWKFEVKREFEKNLNGIVKVMRHD
jgi:hypothetical protein